MIQVGFARMRLLETALARMSSLGLPEKLSATAPSKQHPMHTLTKVSRMETSYTHLHPSEDHTVIILHSFIRMIIEPPHELKQPTMSHRPGSWAERFTQR